MSVTEFAQVSRYNIDCLNQKYMLCQILPTASLFIIIQLILDFWTVIFLKSGGKLSPCIDNKISSIRPWSVDSLDSGSIYQDTDQNLGLKCIKILSLQRFEFYKGEVGSLTANIKLHFFSYQRFSHFIPVLPTIQGIN